MDNVVQNSQQIEVDGIDGDIDNKNDDLVVNSEKNESTLTIVRITSNDCTVEGINAAEWVAQQV